jgi:hypothetical protein
LREAAFGAFIPSCAATETATGQLRAAFPSYWLYCTQTGYDHSVPTSDPSAAFRTMHAAARAMLMHPSYADRVVSLQPIPVGATI